MNFIFISPNFPANYWHFCQELKKNGATVLGIGDCRYDDLDRNLRISLDEYYKVNSLENYDEVFRAVAFFTFKYGKIDWLESNNEYWLERDAALRTEFHITTGFMNEDMHKVKYKSAMKEYYKKAGIPTARWHIADDPKKTKAFIKRIGGYPVIVKPDNGVGAGDTHKIKSEEELDAFFARKHEEPYICEELVHGVVCSFDAVIDSKGEPIFETGNVSPISIMDIVNDAGNSFFYMVKNLAPDVREAGHKTVKAFGVKSRFVHLEFFRLTEDQKGLGKAGDIVGLEVNMRPSGGVSPDMYNFANSTDAYKIWADMVCFDHSDYGRDGQHYYCGFAGRRDGRNFVLSNEEAQAKYADKLVMTGPVQEALSSAMGNYMFMGRFDTEEEMYDFVRDVFAEK